MISDTRGICHEIGYDKLGRVTSVRKAGTKKLENGTLIDTCPVNGGGIDITYYDNSTVVEDIKTGLRTVYRFDDCGHVLCCYEDLRYSSINDNGITPTKVFEYGKLLNNTLKCETNGCYPTIEAALSGTYEMHPNYLSNSTFTQTYANGLPKDWTVVGTTACSCCGNSGSSGVVSGGYESGFNAFKFSNPCNARSNKYICQTVSLEGKDIKGNFLIASAWVKAINPLQSPSSSVCFRLCARLTLSDGTILRKTANYDYSRKNEWQYLAIPLEIADGKTATSAEIRVDFSNNTGDFYVSNIRLTETRGTTTYINYDVTQYTILGDYKRITRRVMTHDGLTSTCTSYDTQFDPVETSVTKDGINFYNYAKYDDMHQAIQIESSHQSFTTNYFYDDSGFEQSILMHDKDDLTKDRVLIEPKYDSSTGLLLSTTDTRGVETQFEYYEEIRQLHRKKRPEQTYEYTYHSKNDALTNITAYVGGVPLSNDFSYLGGTTHLTDITHNGFNYSFNYDPLGRITKTRIAGTDFVSNTYSDGELSSVTSNYANGHTSYVKYDGHGNPIKKTVNGTTVSTAEYDGRGNLLKMVDKIRNICYTYRYNTDGTVKQIEMRNASDNALQSCKFYEYDNAQRLTWAEDTKTGTEKTFIYKTTSSGEIDPSDTVVGVNVSGKFIDKVDCDSLDRAEKHTLTLQGDSTPLITNELSYLQYKYFDGNYNYTGFVDGYKHSCKSKTTGVNTVADWKYVYDAAGNITEVYENDNLIAQYSYDSLNRLERDYSNGSLVAYVYDDGGNIQSKTVDGITYSYGYSNTWKDLLTSFNGQAISYDEIGNPTIYKGETLVWDHVRRLKSYGSNTFTYGADGIRYQKNNTTYVLDGSTILQESDGTKTLKYYYGVNGVVGFRYKNADYYYGKNLLGDVIAIYDANGNIVARYSYDAWGNHTPSEEDKNNEIWNVNPFRYRSYYYDIETGLYYLESRYYDPQTGRFINADSLDYLGDGEDLKNYNLFAYCGNNPVMYSDPTGHIPFFILSALVLGAVGAIAGGLIAHNTDNNIWAGIGIGFAIGAVAGAAIGIAVSYSATGTATASFTDIRFGYALKAAQKGDYSRLAKFATHNRRSKQVGLGKYIEGSPYSYEALSKANKYTYYELKPNYWDKMKAILGNNTWEVNRTFLDQQVAKGKSFVKLSNNYTCDYYRELEYLGLL